MDNKNSEKIKYTFEQKVITAVWVHERQFNKQTWETIKSNFRLRFQVMPPNLSTMMKWEKRLFSPDSSSDHRLGRPASRLLYVPYVRDSLQENPELSIRERSSKLGIPRSTLMNIMKRDLNVTFEYEDNEDDEFLKSKRTLTPAKGLWKAKDEETNSTNNLNNISNVSDISNINNISSVNSAPVPNMNNVPNLLNIPNMNNMPMPTLSSLVNISMEFKEKVDNS